MKINPHIQELLFALGQMATNAGFKCFVVGGLVRDALLGIESKDIDIAVESNDTAAPVGIEFAEFIFDNLTNISGLNVIPKRVDKFKRYGTARLFYEEAANELVCIDFVTCRTEIYETLGARPKVIFSSFKDDLRRRDFSVNTLGFSLNDFCLTKEIKILDYCNGVHDLKNKELNVLHDKSFADDATRLIRGIRYISRFDGFHFGLVTQKLFDEAVKNKYLQNISKERLDEEMKKVHAEKDADRILQKLNELGLLVESR